MFLYADGAVPTDGVGSCDGERTHLACSDDYGDTRCSRLRVQARQDLRLYLRLVEWNRDDAGDYGLTVTVEPP